MKIWKILFLLFFVSLAVRLILFYTFYNDEIISWDTAVCASIARNFINGSIYDLFDTYFPPIFPALIGALFYFTNSFVESIQIISLFTGSLAAPAIYIFVKEFYSVRHAIIAGLFATCFPHLLNSTFGFLGENIYLLIMVCVILLFWNGLKTGSALKFGLAGFFLALGYLTRPEAVGYLLFFVLIILIKFFYVKNYTKPILKSLFVFITSFILVASPYIIYLRSETGNWTLSAKLRQNLFAGKISVYSQKNSNGAQKADIKDVLIKSVVYNSFKLHKSIPIILPPFLFLIIGFGFLSRPWTKDILIREMYLFSFCAVTIIGYLLTVIEWRYFFILFPIFFGWMASGIIEIKNRLGIVLTDFRQFKYAKWISYFFVPLCLVFFLIYTLPANNFLSVRRHGSVQPDKILKKAGEWINKNSDKPNIMAADPRLSLYSDGAWFSFYQDTSQVLQAMIEKKIDYLVVDELHITNNSEFSHLLYSSDIHPLLHPVYSDTTINGKKLIIYQNKFKSH